MDLRLFVGDTLVIDGPNAGGSREGKLRVTAGQTLPLWLEYYQRGGDAHLRLFWQWQGHPREPLPASALGHDQRDAQVGPGHSRRQGQCGARRTAGGARAGTVTRRTTRASTGRSHGRPAMPSPSSFVPDRICSSTST